jgi:ribosome maturation factor RimP
MKKNIRDTVRDAISPTVTELGYDIWDITYQKIGADYHLEITIDKEGGIDIEDCEKVHRAIDPILDECDPIEGFYYLDVSSPGIERELRTAEHISHSIGQKVLAKLFAQKDGKKTVKGILTAFEYGKLTITEPTGDVILAQNEISKINTVFFED